MKHINLFRSLIYRVHIYVDIGQIGPTNMTDETPTLRKLNPVRFQHEF